MRNEDIIYLSIENIDFINYLKEHTKCTELRKFIEVLPIIKLEKGEI
ncbi:MAG: hypothetical protein LBK13_00420 [Spirochaetales bacterium]|jgi:hypothetical protein|nr:hypothetical protein [Spirochaetales bacterium]